jgi:hypothetical protein
VAAYGYLAPPDTRTRGARRRRLDGQQRQQPERRQALARHVRAAVVGDHERVTQGPEIAKFKAPPAHPDGHGRRVHGPAPGPFTTRPSRECFIEGTVPTDKETYRVGRRHRRGDGPAVAGRLRRSDGHAGFFDLSEVEANFPNWQKANKAWGARRPRGSGVRGGPKGRGRRTSTTARSRRSAGRGARRSCRDKPALHAAGLLRPFAIPDPLAPPPSAPCRSRPDPGRGLAAQARRDRGHAKPQTATATRAVRTRRSSPRRRPRRAAGRIDFTGWSLAASDRVSTAPSHPVDDQTFRGRQRRVVEVAVERVERLSTRAAQVERRGDRPRASSAARRVRSASARGAVGPRSVSRADAGTRSSTSTVTRMPAGLERARAARSSAAIRPSQPPLRLRARSPSRHVRRRGRAPARPARAAAGQPASASARPSAASRRAR